LPSIEDENTADDHAIRRFMHGVRKIQRPMASVLHQDFDVLPHRIKIRIPFEVLRKCYLRYSSSRHEEEELVALMRSKGSVADWLLGIGDLVMGTPKDQSRIRILIKYLDLVYELVKSVDSRKQIYSGVFVVVSANSITLPTIKAVSKESLIDYWISPI
jgi:hypothetical protein